MHISAFDTQGDISADSEAYSELCTRRPGQPHTTEYHMSTLNSIHRRTNAAGASVSEAIRTKCIDDSQPDNQQNHHRRPAVEVYAQERNGHVCTWLHAHTIGKHSVMAVLGWPVHSEDVQVVEAEGRRKASHQVAIEEQGEAGGRAR